MVELSCRRCSAAFETRDVNVELGIARCRRCAAVMDLEGSRQARRRVRTAMPRGFSVQTGPGTFEARFSWFKLLTFFTTLFCVVWFGFLFGFYGQAVRNDVGVLQLLFPLLHVGAGLYLAYLTLAQWVNSTTVSVEGRMLRITHGPLPWRGGGEWNWSAFEQLHCRSRRVRVRHGEAEHFELLVRRKDGGELVLLKDLDSAEQVLWLEQELEKVLGIEDLPVANELAQRAV